MKNYYSHAIFYVSARNQKTDIPVWEDIMLIRARSAPEARRKALAAAKKHAEVNRDMFLDGQKARLIFAGIRKIISYEEFLGSWYKEKSGDEITSSRYSAKSMKDVKALARGKAVEVVYED